MIKKKKPIEIKYDHFSYSGISVFLQCAKRWYLKYQVKPTVEIDQTYFSLGTACHGIMEYWKGGTKKQFLQLMQEQFNEHDVMKYWKPEDVIPMIKNCKSFFDNYLKGKEERVHRELSFNMNVGPYKSSGKIDLIIEPLFDENGELIEKGYLIDYKTSGKAELKADMREQLQLYMAGIKTMYPTWKASHFRFGIYFIRFNDLVETTFTDDDIDAKIIDFERKCNRVQQSEFNKNAGVLCNWCEYNGTEHCQGENGND